MDGGDAAACRKHTRQTSPGKPAVGTTYVDETSQGAIPGKMVELEVPREIVYHWWEKSKAASSGARVGRATPCGRPAKNETLVRHHAKLNMYGVYQLAAPVFRRIAVRERSVTVDCAQGIVRAEPGLAPE